MDYEPLVETYTETIQVSKQCGPILFIFSKCPETKTVERTHLAIHEVEKTRLKEQCCPGYTMKEGKCIPMCAIHCRNAQCTGVNKCTCNEGYIPSSPFRFLIKNILLPFLLYYREIIFFLVAYRNA